MSNIIMNSTKIVILNRLALASLCAAAVMTLGMVGYTGLAQTPQPSLPAGVQDVIKLTKAGMTEDVILAQVRNAGVSYNLSADQVIYLSDQGVSQNVIKALLAASPGSTPAPPSSAPGDSVVTPQPGPTAPPSPTATYAPTTVPMPTEAPPVGSPVSFDYFRAQLAPYGTWVEVPGYGWCWRPAVTLGDPFWRPYDNAGHWVYTDNGWFWQSDY